MEKYNFGPNVIYFVLGITKGRPAVAVWADKIVFWVRNASRRGWKSVHAGAFWADKSESKPNVVVLAHYDKIQNFMENRCPNDMSK